MALSIYYAIRIAFSGITTELLIYVLLLFYRW